MIRGKGCGKDVKIRLMSWIHYDAQGLVLCCWELGLPWCLFMKGEVRRFFGSCYLGVVVAMMFVHERGGWEVFLKLFPLNLNCFHKFMGFKIR